MSIPFINLQKQYQSNKKAIDQRIAKVLEHVQYIMGPEVSQLEHALTDHLGVKYERACSSGTDVLILPLMTKRLSRSAVIFTSPFTFFASSEAITHAGATLVFVDIAPETYAIDPASLELCIQKVIDAGELVPRGIIPIDLFGLAADYDKINAIAEKFDLFVIEDAAQSFGADYNGRKAGSLAGDGGAIFTNDDELYDQLVSLRVHGQATCGGKYDNVRKGMNARMDTIQAAVLLEKLKLYDEELVERNRVAKCCSENLIENIVTPTLPSGQGSVWAQYSIQVPDRAKLQNDLRQQGIPTAVFYSIPIHLSTAYKHLNYSVGDFPMAEEVSHKIDSLPVHPFSNNDEVVAVTQAVNDSVSS